MSEKKLKLEPCTLEEATHVEMGGLVSKLGQDEFTSEHQVLKYNNFNIEVHKGGGSGNLIHVNAFPLLGIKPLKEKKREPIEFEATFVMYDGCWQTLHSLEDRFPDNCKKATFRCVEILEDEE